MDQGLTIFKTGAQVSTAFRGITLPTARLDEGVEAGFARVTYKGKNWGVRYQGKMFGIPFRMPDGTVINSPWLDVVLLRAAHRPNKAWYEGSYTEGDSQPPDCWSSDGHKPDESAPKRQSPTCVGCKWNVWGSKVQRETGVATRGKACMDMKRVAVVPVGDIENKMFGGPMLLSIPPSSLKRLGPYQNMLEANGFNYVQVWTRIAFEADSAFPLFAFDAMSALNDVQAAQVVKMLEHPLINRILNTEMKQVEAWDDSAEQVHRDIATAAVPAQTVYPGDKQGASPATPETDDPGPPPDFLRRPQPAPQPQPAPAPAPQPVQTAPEPDPEPEPAPAPQLPPGITLPAGMTPEMAAAFMAQFAGQQAPAKRGRGRPPRTPPVSPAPTDSAAVAAAAAPALPTPVGFSADAAPPPTTPTNGQASVSDPAVAQLMSTINKLI